MGRTVNEWADFWRYTIGVNVIPATGVLKKTWISWKDDPRGNWQTTPIPLEIHEEWKRTGAFKNGMAVICGKVLHREDRKHLYFCAVDADNKKAIDCLTENIEELAKKTLVERHANLEKAHIYVYTTKPMQKKSSDATNLELLAKMQNNEIPAIELKGEGTHGIMYCTPSPHKDGSNYYVIGTEEPMIMDEVGDIVNKLCDEFSLGKDSKNLVPMNVLMDNDTKVIAGSNRHEAIMRYAESILRKYPRMEQQIFDDLIKAKNNRMCVPPLDDKELEVQIECAKKFINKQIEEEKRIREYARHKFGTNEFWIDVKAYVDTYHPRGFFVKCLDCNKDIEANPLNYPHDGHRVMLK